MIDTKTFKYKGINVIYDAEWNNEDEIASIIDDLFEDYYENLKNINTIDFSQYDLNYPIIDGEIYEYDGITLEPCVEDEIKQDDIVDESFNNQELQEFDTACKQLGLDSFEDILKFKAEHNCKNEKELLQVLKDETKSKNECVDDVRFITEGIIKDVWTNILDDKNNFSDIQVNLPKLDQGNIDAQKNSIRRSMGMDDDQYANTLNNLHGRDRAAHILDTAVAVSAMDPIKNLSRLTAGIKEYFESHNIPVKVEHSFYDTYIYIGDNKRYEVYIRPLKANKLDVELTGHRGDYNHWWKNIIRSNKNYTLILNELINVIRKWEFNKLQDNKNYQQKVDSFDTSEFNTTQRDIDKMNYYRNKGSDPYRLASSIKDEHKLISRLMLAANMGWEEAVEAFKDRLQWDFKKPEEMIDAYIQKGRNLNIAEALNENLFNAEEVDETVDEEPKEKEPQTFEEKMDFLAADEQEAIDGYEKIIATIEDEHVKEQLNKIMIEEKAHKEYLEKVKEDQSIDYTEPLEDEEKEEEKPEEVEETEKEEIDENLKLREGKEVTDYTWSEICTKMKEEPLIALNGGNNYQYVGKVKDLDGNEKMAVIGVSHSLKDLYNDYPKSKKLKVYIPANRS